MRILIADKFSSSGQETLRALGHEVVFEPGLGAGDLPAVVTQQRPDVLVVRSTEVTEATFAAGTELALVIRAGAGVNTIDLESASRRGVFVANCPGKNAIAVVELAFGLILALDRRLCEANAELRAGTWNKKAYGKAKGLFGRRLGLIGYGAISRELAKRARAFGMRVTAFSPSIDRGHAEQHKVHVAQSLAELLETSDVVSIHVPFRESTRHMIGARELALLPDGALLIHTSRGGVVDDRALAEAVSSGRIRAGLDVYEDEPSAGVAPFDNPLAKLDGIYGTPHIGASTEQAEEAIAEETVRIVREFAERGSVPNVVNLDTGHTGHYALVIRHQDRVGVLAKILEALRRHQLNVQEMSNVVFKGADGAASATIVLENEPSAELINDIRSHEAVLGVDLRSVA
ncbi:D-3-phosphoglycerate dehydrogenase [Enhygromyxa salina]|uniref:D-3-phosphoglycerate dehydrogenase n=1 Tax=Enhygromyxa salina TaxID=215803 RepID=A0A0C1ZPX3_9BACT|nr:phosphoglycerate dehydrogenase [Enhygromyxa salina]KIG13058.1 D-3-phosphoglycerate dehydrogenase [Enhygromyxa salina]